ncbi:hypothetical protein D3C86_1224530 [compost metagenome]
MGQLLHVEGDLGDQDDVDRAGHARLEGDPARGAAHDLEDHHPVVALGGGEQLVDGLGGRGHRRVEAEGLVRRVEVVVDGLGDADQVHALLGQVVPDAEGAVAADEDQRIQAQLVVAADHLVRHVLEHGLAILDDRVLEGVAAVGGPEDGAAPRDDAADVVEAEGHDEVRLEQAVEAVPNADDLPAVLGDRHLGDGADDGVQAGGIPAAGRNCDALGHGFWFLPVSLQPICQSAGRLVMIRRH